MLQVIRSYYNASDELLRIDTIVLRKKGSVLVRPATELTWERVLKTQLYHGTGISRTVAKIEIAGSFDIVETSSGNYLECEWYSPPVLCNMTDLPAVGEDV